MLRKFCSILIIIPLLSSLIWRLRRYILPGSVIPLPISGTTIKININPQSYMGSHLYFFGIWEEEVTKFVLDLKPEDVIIDIGAHIGYYTLLFTRILSKEGKIIAFEPGKEAHRQLIENIRSVNENIQLESLAVSDKTGEIFLKGDKVVSKDASYDYQINCVSLDDYFLQKKLLKVDLIKIDIEGHELLALKGMNNVLKAYKPILLIEVHPVSLLDFGATNKDVEAFLIERGYNIRIISKDSINNYMIYCS